MGQQFGTHLMGQIIWDNIKLTIMYTVRIEQNRLIF